jgi:hypothetical protein
VVYYQYGNSWNYTILNRGDFSVALDRYLKRERQLIEVVMEEKPSHP